MTGLGNYLGVVGIDPGLRHSGVALLTPARRDLGQWEYGRDYRTLTLRADAGMSEVEAAGAQTKQLASVLLDVEPSALALWLVLEVPATAGVYGDRRGAVRGRGTAFGVASMLANARLTGALLGTALRIPGMVGYTYLKADRLSKATRTRRLKPLGGVAQVKNEHERDALWLALRQLYAPRSLTEST